MSHHKKKPRPHSDDDFEPLGDRPEHVPHEVKWYHGEMCDLYPDDDDSGDGDDGDDGAAPDGGK